MCSIFCFDLGAMYKYILCLKILTKILKNIDEAALHKLHIKINIKTVKYLLINVVNKNNLWIRSDRGENKNAKRDKLNVHGDKFEIERKKKKLKLINGSDKNIYEYHI